MRLLKILTPLLLVVPAVTGAQDPETPPASAAGPRVAIVTNLGSFVIELDPDRAPFTVDSFLNYVRQGHYSGTIFHRVIHGFVAQAGGFFPDFTEKPVGQSVVNESGNGLSNLRGTVGLARTSEPHSGTAQFYVNLADNLDLNPRPTRWGYTVFGRVVEGMDVVDEIGQKPTGAGGVFERDVPVETIVIERAEILSE
jgi:peptidyl-prolyl cis-trans isomerase A (cyclophilin A)/peptidyl-prolyl cis-trans isomerase B (cyclophilin B)